MNTIGELVAKDYRKAHVLNAYHIDYCNEGEKSLYQVCEERSLDVNEVNDALNALGQPLWWPSMNVDKWEIDFLAEFIEQTHHRYAREAIPKLVQYTDKLAKSRGEDYPELYEVAKIFRLVSENLLVHMEEEEELIFKYIKDLAEAKRNHEHLMPASFGTITHPIKIKRIEHKQLIQDIKRIHLLTHRYNVPEGSPASFRATFNRLKAFESDVFLHVHLENNVLFPKAIAMEQSLVELIAQ